MTLRISADDPETLTAEFGIVYNTIYLRIVRMIRLTVLMLMATGHFQTGRKLISERKQPLTQAQLRLL